MSSVVRKGHSYNIALNKFSDVFCSESHVLFKLDKAVDLLENYVFFVEAIGIPISETKVRSLTFVSG